MPTVRSFRPSFSSGRKRRLLASMVLGLLAFASLGSTPPDVVPYEESPGDGGVAPTAEVSTEAAEHSVDGSCDDTGAATTGFSDVSIKNVHGDAISCMATLGIIQGHSDGTFDPAGALTRGQMSSMLAHFIAVADPDVRTSENTTPFTDIAGSVHADGIATLHDLGIASGVSRAIFRPHATLTRGQMASLVLGALNELTGGLGLDRTKTFEDVLSSSTHGEAIEILAGHGIVNGLTSDTFGASSTLKRQQAASLLRGSARVLRERGRWAPDSGEGDPDQAEFDGTSTSWSNPASWPSGHVPEPGDAVVIHGRVVVDRDVDVDSISIPVGSSLEFDPATSVTVQAAGNVVVEGRLRIRPSAPDVQHVLRFVGIDEREVVGGHTDIPLATDVGLWVVGDGILDAQGTDKAGWNRTGNDETWADGDDIRVTPTAQGDTETFAAFTAGDRVPTVTDPRGDIHRAEVFNLTRNVRIESAATNTPEVLDNDGRAHVIFLHCTQSQTIRNVAITGMGPRQPNGDFTTGVVGRYPLHFHHCEDGSRGSLVENVVVESSGNRAFVPHGSHGITFRDTVAFDVFEHAYWWDADRDGSYPANASHDVVYDHALAALVKSDPSFRGFGLTGFMLGQGEGNACLSCVAVGVQGNSNASGFQWPESANGKPNVWEFDGSVAHNNRMHGAFTWQNDGKHHPVHNFTAYRNGAAGISHGAYLNGYEWVGFRLWDNGHDLALHALSPSNGNLLTFEDGLMGSETSVVIKSHSLASDDPVVLRNNDIRGVIVVDEDRSELKPGVIHFVSNEPQIDLTPDDFDVQNLMSNIVVFNSDGSNFNVVE